MVSKILYLLVPIVMAGCSAPMVETTDIVLIEDVTIILILESCDGC